MPPTSKSAQMIEQIRALYTGDLRELRAQAGTLQNLGRRIAGEIEEAVANNRAVQLGEELTTAMHTSRQIFRLTASIETHQKLLATFHPGAPPKVHL